MKSPLKKKDKRYFKNIKYSLQLLKPFHEKMVSKFETVSPFLFTTNIKLLVPIKGKSYLYLYIMKCHSLKVMNGWTSPTILLSVVHQFPVSEAWIS